MRDEPDDTVLRRIAREGKWQPFWGAFFSIARVPLIGPYLLLYMLLGIPVVAVVVVAQAQVPRDQLGTAQAVVTRVVGTDRVASKLEYKVEIEGVPYTGEVQWATKENGGGPWTIGDRFEMHYDKRHPWIRWRKDPIPFWLFLPLTFGITVVLWGAGYAWWMTQHAAPARATPQELAWLAKARELLEKDGEFAPRALDEACGRRAGASSWSHIAAPLDALIESSPHGPGRAKRRMDTYAKWRAQQAAPVPFRAAFAYYAASVRHCCAPSRAAIPAVALQVPDVMQVFDQSAAQIILLRMIEEASDEVVLIRRYEVDLRSVRTADVHATVEKLRAIQAKVFGHASLWSPDSIDWESKEKKMRKLRKLARKAGIPEAEARTCRMTTHLSDGTRHEIAASGTTALCTVGSFLYAMYECPWRQAPLKATKVVADGSGSMSRVSIEYIPGDRLVIERAE